MDFYINFLGVLFIALFIIIIFLIKNVIIREGKNKLFSALILIVFGVFGFGLLTDLLNLVMDVTKFEQSEALKLEIWRFVLPVIPIAIASNLITHWLMSSRSQ